jgi:hypothetical protein
MRRRIARGVWERIMRICIMGDSHVGSLKRGWDNIYDVYPDKEIVFFAHRANGLNDLIVRDGKLVPNNGELAKALEFTARGKAEIDPVEYDVFIIYGVGANVNFTFNSLFYSKAVIRRSLNDFVENTLSFNLLKKLRAVTNKTIFIGHAPLRAAIQTLPDTKPADYLSRVRLINEVVYAPLHSELVLQPINTIVNGNSTHSDFSKGSKRLAVGDGYDNEFHPEDDNDHMNDIFGAIWLKEFMINYLEKRTATHSI